MAEVLSILNYHGYFKKCSPPDAEISLLRLASQKILVMPVLEELNDMIVILRPALESKH